MMNVLNGGAHADNNVDVQEFMVVPSGRKLPRGAALRRRVLPRVEVGVEKERAVDGGRGRGRIRTESPQQRRGTGRAVRRGRQGRLQIGRRTSCWRSTSRPRSCTRDGNYRFAAERETAQGPRRDGRDVRQVGQGLPDRVDRGRDGRGRLERLDDADRSPRRSRPTRR